MVEHTTFSVMQSAVFQEIIDNADSELASLDQAEAYEVARIAEIDEKLAAISLEKTVKQFHLDQAANLNIEHMQKHAQSINLLLAATGTQAEKQVRDTYEETESTHKHYKHTFDIEAQRFNEMLAESENAVVHLSIDRYQLSESLVQHRQKRGQLLSGRDQAVGQLKEELYQEAKIRIDRASDLVALASNGLEMREEELTRLVSLEIEQLDKWPDVQARVHKLIQYEDASTNVLEAYRELLVTLLDYGHNADIDSVFLRRVAGIFTLADLLELHQADVYATLSNDRATDRIAEKLNMTLTVLEAYRESGH